MASLYVKSTVDICVSVLAYAEESVRSGQVRSGAAAFRAKGWLCLRQSHFRFVCINRVCVDEVEPQVDIVLYLIFRFLPLCAVSSSIQDFERASVIQVVDCHSLPPPLLKSRRKTPEVAPVEEGRVAVPARSDSRLFRLLFRCSRFQHQWSVAV